MTSYSDFSSDAEAGSETLAVLALSLLRDIPDARVNDSATLTWRINNWTSTTSAVRSPHFMCAGMKWRLVCYPRGTPDSRTKGNVSLYLDRGDFGNTTHLPPICVQFSLVVSSVTDSTNHVSQTMAGRVEPGEVLSGFDRFCSANQLLQPRPGQVSRIVNGGEVDITVFLRIMEDPTGELWTDGVPRPPAAPTLSPSPSASSPRPVASSRRGPSTTNDPPKEKSLPPMRAAYPGEECMICADEALLFPQKAPTALCQHEARVCLPCLKGHISSEISAKGAIDVVVCPAPDCPEGMDYHEIKFWSDDSAFARYDRALTRRALGLEDGFVTCANAACEAGQIHGEGANAPIVTCHVCHHRTCFTHQIAWHEGYTCDEWDAEQKTKLEVATTAEYLSKFTKLCPNCKKPIEKDAGCDHLTCKPPAGCGHQFCWMCMAPYEPIRRDGNHRHDPSCKYYVAWNDPSTSTPVVPAPASRPPAYTPTPAALSYIATPATRSDPTASAPGTSVGMQRGRRTWYSFWKGR